MTSKASSPPPLALRVAITGHRWRLPDETDGRGLDPAQASQLRDALATVFHRIAETVNAVAAEPDAFWRPAPPQLTLVTALAEGADTLAGEAAIDVGFAIDVVAPYDLASYATRCAPGTPGRRIWDRATSRLILDGEPGADELVSDGSLVRSEAALVETNRRLIWNCDLLIALWDGRPARGEAGTARVVLRALEEGVPVIHVPTAAPNAWRVLDAPGGLALGPSGPDDLDTIVRRLLAPPATTTVGGHDVLARAIADYARESPPGWIVRHVTSRIYNVVTYLLSGFDEDARVTALPPESASIPPAWASAPGCDEADTRRADLLDPHFQRADFYATVYAARHRSTFTTMLMLAPLAVVCAWAGSVAPEVYKSRWAIAELATLLILVGFFFRSRQLRFHERWLDYRLLAERLRHHGFLWMLGRTSPVLRVPTHAVFSDPRPAWVNWQYRLITRPLGVAPLSLTPNTLRALAADMRRGLLDAQTRYCRSTHRIAQRADRRLHGLPWIPLLAAIVAAATHVATQVWHLSLPPALEGWITPIGVIGPALGAALHGFASQSGFQEVGIRADASAQQLDQFLVRLEAIDFDHPLASRALGDLELQIADVLGEDLAGWRVDWLARPLTPPG